MIRALSHVAIQVTDLERAAAFYRDVVGLREHFRLHRDDGGLMLIYLKVAPGQFIELFGGSTAAHKPRTEAGPVHLCLEVDDIQKAYRQITARGARSLHGEPAYEADHAWQFWIADPDGNPIEFHQFTENSLQLRGANG